MTWKSLIAILAMLVSAAGTLAAWAIANHKHTEIDSRIDETRKEAKGDLVRHSDAVDEKFHEVYQRQYEAQSEQRDVNRKLDYLMIEMSNSYPKGFVRADALPSLIPPSRDGGTR